MQSKYVLYFFLAVLPSLMGVSIPPTTAWDWFKLIGQAVYQGLLAMKALQSLPDASTSTTTTTTSLAPANSSPSPVIGKPIVPVIILFFLCSLMGCTTTTTKNVDGSTTTTTQQDPKSIKALEQIGEITGQAFGTAAADAAVQAIKDQQSK